MTHLPRCGPTGRWLVATWLLAVAACSSDRHLTAPGTRPAFDISDARHGGGTPGFFFLPPLVAQPTTGGAFDADIATLNPQVAICDITLGPDADCGGSSEGATPAIVVYTSTSTPAITVVPTASTYSVNWDTKLEGFVTGHTYRVHVAAGEIGTRRELGFADVLLTTTPGQVKDLATGDLISLNDGRTLPIRFRIESGIPGALAVTAASPGPRVPRPRPSRRAARKAATRTGRRPSHRSATFRARNPRAYLRWSSRSTRSGRPR